MSTIVKRIFATAKCITSLLDDGPNSVLVELTTQGVERINELADGLKRLNVSEISDYFRANVWSNALVDIGSVDGTKQSADQLAQAMGERPERMDVEELVVFPDGFEFTAIPKHAGYEARVHTPRIAFTHLQGEAVDIVISEE